MTTGGVDRLRRRADYLRVQANQQRNAQPGLLLQAAPADDLPSGNSPSGNPCSGVLKAPAAMRVGFTASRKVGNAVMRNRAKRRLRALARECLGRNAMPGHDYVLVARAATPSRAYADLRHDLEAALKRLKLWRTGI